MKVEVRVKPQAKTTSVELQANGSLLVKVKEPAKDGKANDAVIRAVADYFGLPKSTVKIVHGLSSRNKILEI